MKHLLVLFLLLAILRAQRVSCAPHPLRTSAAYGYSYSNFTAGWGASYRVNDNFYHQFSIDYTRYKSSCLYRRFNGYGAQLTSFNNRQYSFGLRYYSAIRRFYAHNFIPYWGIAPSFFRFKNGSGFNCKPVIGIKFSPIYETGFNLDFDLTYGYDVPFLHANAFTAGRHDLSATVSLGIDLNNLTGLFKKDERRIDAKF